MNVKEILSTTLIGIAFSGSVYANTDFQKEAVLSCDSLIKKESASWSSWAAGQGLTKEELSIFVSNLCFSGLSTAKNANSLAEIDEWQIAMFNRMSALGLGPLNVNAVQESTRIAKDFYRKSHGLKEESTTKAPTITYPQLPSNATSEQRVAALNEYSSKKTIRGITIKSHCESLTKKMPDNSSPTQELRNVAIQVCKGVMVKNITNGEHGISGTSSIELAVKTYGKDSTEYQYVSSVVNRAFSESK
ncbi:TPA: hypothetical protein ACIFST_000046 [Citrobacter farmeri]